MTSSGKRTCQTFCSNTRGETQVRVLKHKAFFFSFDGDVALNLSLPADCKSRWGKSKNVGSLASERGGCSRARGLARRRGSWSEAGTRVQILVVQEQRDRAQSGRPCHTHTHTCARTHTLPTATEWGRTAGSPTLLFPSRPRRLAEAYLAHQV